MGRIMVLCLFLLMTWTPAADAQKADSLRKGPAEPPLSRASENTDYDVADGLPAIVLGALDADDSTYNRQVSGCGGLSGIGTSVFYDTVTVTNTSGGFLPLSVATSNGNDPNACSIDTVLSAYSPTFNAADPLSNCLTSDDDAGPAACSEVSFDLAAGQTVVLVVTSFANGAQFPYRVTLEEQVVPLSSTSGLLLPKYDLDLGDPNGPTTLLNVRNTTDNNVDVRFDYYSPRFRSAPLRTDFRSISSQRVSVNNLRNDTSQLDPDADNNARGLILVRRTDTNDATDLEGDALNVDFGNDFATGERLFRIPEDFCTHVETRFLNFGSGTTFTVVVDEPGGADTPSFTYTAYSEPGIELVADAEFFTSTHLNIIDFQDLVGMGANFGSIIFDFSNSGGGLVVGEYSAFGRFSAGFKGACRDVVP